jgi:hypothetical protein
MLSSMNASRASAGRSASELHLTLVTACGVRRVEVPLVVAATRLLAASVLSDAAPVIRKAPSARSCS